MIFANVESPDFLDSVRELSPAASEADDDEDRFTSGTGV
jgi:hypothetical protein